MPWKEYRYFDPETVGLDFAGLMEDLRAAPDGSIILLHGACGGLDGVVLCGLGGFLLASSRCTVRSCLVLAKWCCLWLP